jgi:phage shock protein PspC (stress-responsive transcriptional regulator)
MGTVSTFLAALVLSLLIGEIVGIGLANYWNADLELIAVLVMIAVFAIVAMAVFAIAYSTAARSQTLNRAAALLVGIVLIGVGALIALVRFENGTPSDVTILIAFLIPALAAILIQWALIARRWRKLHPSASPAGN